MIELFADFQDFLTEFHDAGVDFVIVGGHAVSFHGHTRATKDLDVFVRPSPENAERVMVGLLAFGAPVVQLGLTPRDFDRKGTVVQLDLPPVRIDIISQIDGLSFDEATANRDFMEVSERKIPVIGRDALLRNKLASGRPQDLADVAALSSK